MNSNQKRVTAIFILLLMSFSVAGCSKAKKESSSIPQSSSESVTVDIDGINVDEMFTNRDKEIGYDESTATAITLSDSSIRCDSSDVTISKNTATIKNEGTYVLSGSSENGQIIIDAKSTDKIQLVLNGVSLNCNTSAPIYVKQANKVFITLSAKTQNSLSNKSEFIAIDENNINSVIFSMDDLTLNGNGTLEVNAAFGNGIVSKDNLVITSATYKIKTAGHAISGTDSVRIANGTFTISSGKDGIQAENTKDTALGFLYIANGDFKIIGKGDGIFASSILQIDGGTFDINSGGGSENGAVKQELTPRYNDGEKPDAIASATPTVTTATNKATTNATSAKSIKSTGNLIINGGNISIDSADDALHSGANLALTNGTINILSGDDGIHADSNVTIAKGNLTIAKSYEGIEGKSIDIMGGITSICASDDGMNASGGNDQSGLSGDAGKDSFAVDKEAYIKISGGKLTINSLGDGIDSNGSLYVLGGETYVSGSENNGNGAIDYNAEAKITGGIFVAVGASGMAQNFGDSSTQGTILVNLSEKQSGKEILLKDSLGNTIISYTPSKAYNSVVVSCPQVKKGESYTLEVGSQRTAIKMTDIVYDVGGEMGGRPGGSDGGKPPSGGKIGDKPKGEPPQKID